MEIRSMNSDYDSSIAAHYAAYRPDLHSVILSEVLGSQSFLHGLDIGCGTGSSAIALIAYCDDVVGIDSSEAMLNTAKPHERISYQLCSKIAEVKGQFEIITLAGSLPYLKSQSLVDQLSRLLNDQGLIVIYDFDIQLDPILENITFEMPNLKGTYDHLNNLSGLSLENLSFVDKKIVSTNISPSPEEIMHLILSVKEYYLALKRHFLESEIERELTHEIEQVFAQQPSALEAIYNYSIYRKSADSVLPQDT